MPRITFRVQYGETEARSAIETRDLRGIDLSAARLQSVDLTGCLRNPSDPRIRGWFVTEAGTFAYQCATYSCRSPATFGSTCSMCEDCCSERHFTCHSCDNHAESRCEHCEYCRDCCDCSICGDCSRLAHECGYCNNHCQCEDADIQPGRPLRARPGDTFTCNRLVGVELEHNDKIGISDLAEEYGMGYHHDGSCGWEAVTPPMGGDHIARVLGALCKQLKAESSANEDCGIHVHVDASDLGWEDIYRLVWVYAKVEPLLYVLAGQQRLANEYCRPCGQTFKRALSDVDRKGAVLSAAFYHRETDKNSAREHQRSRPGKKDGGRYKGLNLAPWLHARATRCPKPPKIRGNAAAAGATRASYNAPAAPSRNDCTIEFRMHRNSLDADRIIGWTHLLARFVDWVARASDAEAKKLPKSALRALCQIAPDCKPWILARVRAWRVETTTYKNFERFDPTTATYKLNTTRKNRRRVTLKNGEYLCVA